MRFAFVGLAVLVLVMGSGAEEPKPTPKPNNEPRWTQLPLEVCGVDVYRERYPGRDGRGVVVAVLDTGVDMGVAGLTKCPDGSVKVIDAQDFSGEGDVALKPVSVDAKSGKIVRHGKGGAHERRCDCL